MSKFARKTPPPGWDVISDTLTEIDARMRDAENDSHEGKRKQETVWPIFRLHHQKARYVFDMFRDKKITRELYEYCIREKIVDGNLIAKWKKPGFEKLCCLRCIQKKDHSFDVACICRVPSNSLDEDKLVQCVHCGCRGCASGEGGKNRGKKRRQVEVDESELPPALRQRYSADCSPHCTESRRRRRPAPPRRPRKRKNE